MSLLGNVLWVVLGGGLVLCLENLIGAVVCLVLLYLFARLVHRSWSQGTMVYETLVFPEWILFCIAPVTFLLLLAVFARTLCRGPAAARRGVETDGI